MENLRKLFRKLNCNRNEKIKVKMNKPVYLGLSILEIRKALMFEFWYHYIKSECKNNAKL